jgi:hypothetical protein
MHYLTSALDGGEWSASRPGRCTPGKSPGNHWIGGWVGPRAVLDAEVKLKTKFKILFLEGTGIATEMCGHCKNPRWRSAL